MQSCRTQSVKAVSFEECCATGTEQIYESGTPKCLAAEDAYGLMQGASGSHCEQPAGNPGGGFGGRGSAAQRGPPRQPLVVGALAVMLLASSINEVKLGVPAVSIRLGLQACHLLAPGAATLAAKIAYQRPRKSDS